MTLILVHSPKGGAGSTFLAARLAMELAARGHQVTAIDFTYQDALKLHFGLPPAQELNAYDDARADPLVVAGVRLVQGHAGSQHPDSRRALQTGKLFADHDMIVVADVASDDRTLKAALMPHAALHVCAILPRPASLAALTKLDQDTPAVELDKTVLVLNQLDDRSRLSRDTHSFVRQLFGDQLIGTVRRDEALNEALASFETLAKFAPTSIIPGDISVLTTAVERRCGIAAAGPVLVSERL